MPKSYPGFILISGEDNADFWTLFSNGRNHFCLSRFFQFANRT